MLGTPSEGAADKYLLLNYSPSGSFSPAESTSAHVMGYVASKFGVANQASTLKVGVSCLYLPGWNGTASELALLRSDLARAETLGVPILVQVDTETWLPTSLLNWYDPALPGYDPTKKADVEWYGWDDSTAVKLSWRNWGFPFRIGPTPNFLSPKFQAFEKAIYDQFLPVVLAWYNELPANKKWLLVGWRCGVESAINSNFRFFPNGNSYYGISNDPAWSDNYQPLGYNAAKTAGIKTSGTLTTADNAKIVGKHLTYLAKMAYDAGIPREKISVHGTFYGTTQEDVDALVNPYGNPGVSFYGSPGSPLKDNAALMQAVQTAKTSDGATGYCYGELNLFTTDYSTWFGWFKNALHDDPDCVYQALYNFDSVHQIASVESALLDAMALYPVPPPPADGTWSHDGDGLWSANANWSGGSVASEAGFTANFGAIDLTLDRTVHLDSARTIGHLTFGDANTASAAGWTLDNNGNSAKVLTLAGSTPTITVNALGTGKTVTISAELAGTSGLTKAGAGTLILAGTLSYSGPTVVSAGTLQGSAASIKSNVAVNNNAVLCFNETGNVSYGQIVSGAGALTKRGAGTLTLSALQSYGGPTVIEGGTLKLTKSSGFVGGSDGNTVTATANAAASYSAPANMVNGSGMSDSPVMKSSKNNSTWWTTGWLTHVSDNPNFSNGWVLFTFDKITSLNEMVIWNVGTNEYPGNVMRGLRAVTITYSTADATGVGGGTIYTGDLNPCVWGQWPYSYQNDFSFNAANVKAVRIAYTSVWGGDGAGLSEVRFGTTYNDASILPVTTAVSVTGGTLDLGGLSQQVASLDGGGNIINNSGTTSVLTVSPAGGSTTLSGVIGGGGGAISLVMSGSGTQVLSGANTYTGTTAVNAGTLALVGGSQASPITVSAGASLGFTLGSPTTSTSTFNLSAGTIKITGTPNLASYTLITSSAGITGTPILDAPLTGYALQVSGGNTLNLVQTTCAITATGSPLTDSLTITYGTASGAVGFTVSGAYMTAGITVTPPAGFEVSQTAGGASGYAGSGNPITVGATGTIENTTVYVRLAANAPVSGTYNGQNIVLSSAGAIPVNVVTAASGNVVSPKAASVTANNRSKTYGDTVTFAGTEFTPDGFVNGDGVASVTLASAGASNTATVAAPGPMYAITASDATGTGLGNYSITYNPGTFTVLTPYQAWLNGATPTDANLKEFTLGTSNTSVLVLDADGKIATRGQAPIIQTTVDNSEVKLTYARLKNSGCTCSAEFSNNLGVWLPSTDSSLIYPPDAPTEVIVDNGDDMEVVSVKFPIFRDNGGTSVKIQQDFCRIAVTTH